jgi:hypothetical protein
MDRNFLADDRLSYRARGMLGAMLADPWMDTAEAIAGRSKAKGESIKPIYAALHELEAFDYIERVTKLSRSGRPYQVWKVRYADSAYRPTSENAESAVPNTSNSGTLWMYSRREVEVHQKHQYPGTAESADRQPNRQRRTPWPSCEQG